MTEERKQELRQLLEEARESLVILRSGDEPSFIREEVYREHLLQRWTAYSENVRSALVSFTPQITSEVTKSKLLDFIRKEFAQFIHEDKIQSASSFIKGGYFDGFPLDWLLEQLLRIAIARGIEEAVSVFDKCTEETSVSFQHFALLDGIRLEAGIQIYKGIQLVPLSKTSSYFHHYWPTFFASTIGMPEDFRQSKTVLIIDCSVSPIFHKPFPRLSQKDDYPFRVEVNGENFRNFMEDDFCEQFCQALSLACNFSVQIAFSWKFLAEDQLFNLSYGIEGATLGTSNLSFWPSDPFGIPIEAGEAEIEEAKCLYKKLVGLDSNDREKLQIPIDRWIKSKTPEKPIDKMIDLGIAFEVLYVTSDRNIGKQLRDNASRYLGKNEEHRDKLLIKFKQIYKHRSKAVHEGKLGEMAQFGEEEIPISEFIEEAQNLCRKSIKKILDDGEFPDWNSLILGGEEEQAGS